MELVKNDHCGDGRNTQFKAGNISKKLFKVMEQVDEIPKNGFNEHSKYSYVKAVDVVKGVKKLLLKNQIGFRIEEEEVKREEKAGRSSNNFHTQIKCSAVFYCLDNPEDCEKIPYYSASSDSLDKDIFKAKTNGLKYMFIQRFLIESDDALIDTETDTVHPNKAQSYQARNYQNEPKQYKRESKKSNYRDYSNDRAYRSNRNFNRSNNGDSITPNQVEYINYLQCELNLFMHRQEDIVKFTKKQASDVISFYKKEARVMGINA